MACIDPEAPISVDEVIPRTDVTVSDPEMEPVAMILEKEPVPLMVVAPAKVVDPDTLRYPEVSTPVVSWAVVPEREVTAGIRVRPAADP